MKGYNLLSGHSLALWATFAITALSQSCGSTLNAGYPAPIAGDGWAARLIAQNLGRPRSILFDSNGGLLLVQSGKGIVHMTLTDGGGSCVELSSTTTLINSTSLNHGIALSQDGRTLYASSSDAVYSWSYDPETVAVGDTNRTLVIGMDNSAHTTRTLLISQFEPGMLIVSRGSGDNIDPLAEAVTTGHSQLKAFNVSGFDDMSTAYDFTTSGRLLGWGLRNSVGVAEEPLTGGIYTVENSADQISRSGTDVHQNNPGEEMNYHGVLNSTDNQGGNYGYPSCFAVWNTSIPEAGDLRIGSQMRIDETANDTITDAVCASSTVSPRLTFQAHMAPLDIVFSANGTEAYVSFHGSWDRSDPVGYKVSSLAFENGEPVSAADSTTSTTDILVNADNGNCPENCFRPVGLALDGQQRLFMTSDSTGELYVLVKSAEEGTPVTPTESSPTPSTTESGALHQWTGSNSLWVLVAVVICSMW
ncbi:hypothetical protein PVAG01_07292 [Phlyctema vagabunda]|uniref:Pyrroloquinoline quinone-dependent pyranose dehydrogenase beta-propeller domain-containing protein n=1 Tax=Phlyctema vagabunda TaxID=108571 RepID=A0ABR4PCG1_9HELO